MSNNPFKIGSTSYHDYEILKDLKWHCTKHELKSGQAKTWQVWRQKGLQFATDEKGNSYLNKYCENCNQRTIHRALITLDISEDTTIRSSIPKDLGERIKKVLNYEEAVFLRKLLPRELEIDHKFPQVRWSKDEEENSRFMSDGDIKSKFILLSRSNNLLKSRNCERCAETNFRGNFPGIYYWHEGSEKWDPLIPSDDERGCIGCFWYDPYKWREKLNKLIK